MEFKVVYACPTCECFDMGYCTWRPSDVPLWAENAIIDKLFGCDAYDLYDNYAEQGECDAYIKRGDACDGTPRSRAELSELIGNTRGADVDMYTLLEAFARTHWLESNQEDYELVALRWVELRNKIDRGME